MLTDSPACKKGKYYKRRKLTPADSRLIATMCVMARLAHILDCDRHTGLLFFGFSVPDLAINETLDRPAQEAPT